MSVHKCIFRIHIIFYHMRSFNKTTATLVRPHPFSTLCPTPLGKSPVCHCMSPEPGDQEWPLLMKRITHCQIKSCSVHQKYTNAAALELLDPRQPEIQPMVFLIQMSGELIRIKTDIWRPLALLYFSHIEISGNRLKYYQLHKWF